MINKLVGQSLTWMNILVKIVGAGRLPWTSKKLATMLQKLNLVWAGFSNKDAIFLFF